MIKHRPHGFTIVELIIAITVIGILAGIVIVNYNGIRIRANDAKRFAVVDAWEEVLKTYDAKNGHFPVVDSGGDIYNNGDTNRACLGNDFPADATFGAGQCVLSTAFAAPGTYWTLFFQQNTPLNTEIKNAIGGNLPDSRYQMVFVNSIGGDVNHNYKLRGVMYFAERARLDGGGNPIPEVAWIRYALEGGNCKTGDYVWESVAQSSGNEKYRLCERNLLK